MSLLSTQPDKQRLPALAVVLAIVVAIGLIEYDGWKRYQRIVASTDLSMGSPFPEIDPWSPTGYESGMRRLILPQNGLDGFHWIIHTQKMLADGQWRIRDTDCDNAPHRREIHWSHGLIWWLVALGKIHSVLTGLPLPASVEAVAPFANTLILVLLVFALPWLLLSRFGTLASAGLAIGLATNYGMYEYFMIGNCDHHGIVAVGLAMCSLLLAVGGVGWVSVSPDRKDKQREHAGGLPPDYRIDGRIALRFYLASGLAGAIGLWTSAASAVPMLLGVGAGALVVILCFAKSTPTTDVEYRPELWFWWGAAGCIGSIGFYLLEYFPRHMGMRLEVNHPLYALAWLGGGELLFRVGEWRISRRLPWRNMTSGLRTAMALVAIGLVPALVLIAPSRFFWIADDFLWVLHRDYIYEFASLFSWAGERASSLPMIRACFGPVLAGLLVAAIVRSHDAPRTWKSIFCVIAAPALLVTALGCVQIRWLGMASGLWLPVIPAAIAYATKQDRNPFRPPSWRRMSGILAVLGSLFLIPLLSLPESLRNLGRPPNFGVEEGIAVYIRDLAHGIKRENREAEVVVLSGPMTTSYLMYYGGFKGIGTLYWENLPGLKSAARLYSAKNEDEAESLIREHRVSHIAIFDFDSFAYEYPRLLRRLPRDAQPQDAFVPSILANPIASRWLKPIPLKQPDPMVARWVSLMQIAFDQTPAQAHYAFAEFLESRKQYRDAMKEIDKALELDSHFRDALFKRAAFLLLLDQPEKAKEVLELGLEGRPANEVVNLCIQQATRFMEISQHAAAEPLLRRALQAIPNEPIAKNILAWLLATSYDDAVRKPEEAVALAESNHAYPNRVAYLHTLAAAKAANRQFTEAVATIQKAIEILHTEAPNVSPGELAAFQNQLELYRSSQPFRLGSIPPSIE